MMKDSSKTNQELLEVISALKQKIQKLEHPESEPKRTDEALRESEKRFRELAELLPETVYETDINGLLTFVNRNPFDRFGYTQEDFAGGLNAMDMLIPDDRGRALENFQRIMNGENIGSIEYTMLKKNGSTFPALIYYTVIIREGKPAGLRGIVVDITERKQTEEVLRERESKLKSIFTAAPVGIGFVSNRVILEANDTLCLMTDYSRDELLGQNARILYPTDEEYEYVGQDKYRQISQKGTGSVETRWCRRNGEVIHILLSSTPIDRSDLSKGVTFTALDITKRKQFENALRESEAKYRQLFTHAPAGIYEVDFTNGKFIQVNSLMCKYTGYSREELLAMSPLDVLIEESQRLFLERLEKIGKGESVPTNPEFCMKNKDGSIRWVQLNIQYISKAGMVTGASVVAHDITERKLVEDKLLQTLETLRKSFGTIIQVMVAAVETRDPYTSGHQKRSADLARVIATEMGLPQDKIEAIRMAGPIHDIGKLSIPAEILSKPGKLSEVEFSLIKEHARIGSEMLKDVESPWPLSQIIYQHHERMDGSGYPNKLKGEDILIESRILAVADVVESMASHRPYRAALGLNAALDEITKNKGILYDPEVVETCLKLFNEKGYKLSA